MRFLVEFHRNGKLTKGIYSTFIALIPKIKSPQCLSDFGLISLVNYMYKILSKVLANRLRHVIDNVISKPHLTFVKGLHILDKILIANKMVYDARSLKKNYYHYLKSILKKHVTWWIGGI